MNDQHPISCHWCGRPLWKLRPNCCDDRRWIHCIRADAAACNKIRPKTKKPVPVPKVTVDGIPKPRVYTDEDHQVWSDYQ